MRTTDRERGPYAKSAAVKERIVHAAFETFARAGYRGGSLREVADRTEMSEAGLLHHFPSKAALLAAVLEYWDVRASETFALIPANGKETLAEIVALAASATKTPGVVQLFTALSSEATEPNHPAHTYFQRRYTTARHVIAETLREVDMRGELRADVDVDIAALRAVAIWDGMHIQWLFDPGVVDVATSLRAYLESLLATGCRIPSDADRRSDPPALPRPHLPSVSIKYAGGSHRFSTTKTQSTHPQHK